MRTIPLAVASVAAVLSGPGCEVAKGHIGSRAAESTEAVARTTATEEAARPTATVVGAGEGEVRWFMPESADELGDGAEARILIDHASVPGATLGAIVQRTAATGIPVHAHTWQAEIIYVIRGVGVGLVGDGREEVPLEPGSLLYVPEGAWHGFRNTDPDDRLEILLVTRPTAEQGLADFFRRAASRPGERPLELSYDEIVRLIEAHGMELPASDG